MRDLVLVQGMIHAHEAGADPIIRRELDQRVGERHGGAQFGLDDEPRTFGAQVETCHRRAAPHGTQELWAGEVGAPNPDFMREDGADPGEDGIRVEESGTGHEVSVPRFGVFVDQARDGIQPPAWVLENAVSDEAGQGEWCQSGCARLRCGQHAVLRGCQGDQDGVEGACHRRSLAP